MDRDMWFVGGLVIVICLVAVATAISLLRAKCMTYGEVTGRPVVYRTIGGCFAQAESGKWFPSEQIWDEGKR